MDDDREHDSTDPDQDTAESSNDMLCQVDEVPWAPLTFLFGLQQALMTIGGTVSLPFIITGLICAKERPEVRSEILSITIFMCGVATVVQCVFGVRLGIIQGGSHVFVSPIVALMALDKWMCTPEDIASKDDEVWQSRLRQIQGNLALASVTQVLIGCTGFVGILLKFIGPLTIAPTIALIGLSLAENVVDFSSKHWGIAALSMTLTGLFTLYLNKVNLPFPSWSKKDGCHVVWYPLLQLIPVFLGITVSWLFCLILTVTGVLAEGSLARTDAKAEVLEKAPWFYWPTISSPPSLSRLNDILVQGYSFKFGMPTVSAGGYVAFLAATVASIIESVGDYYAAARISGAAPPPAHAVNRGIAMEGFASIISSLVGAGHGTTSYSSNIGSIGITKVASRCVFVTAGILMIVTGVIGKLGALLSIIPEPVIGGTLMVLFGVVTAVGVSSLQFTDLSSTRNLTVFGLSMMLGLSIPQYINKQENIGLINTGSEELDQIITVMCGSAMFVGGLVGCFLDNTVPGTAKERGIIAWRQDTASRSSTGTKVSTTYDLPVVAALCRRVHCCSHFPISPTFDKPSPLPVPKCCRRKRQACSGTEVECAAKYAYDNEVDVAVTVEGDTDRNGTRF